MEAVSIPRCLMTRVEPTTRTNNTRKMIDVRNLDGDMIDAYRNEPNGGEYQMSHVRRSWQRHPGCGCRSSTLIASVYRSALIGCG